MRWQDIPFDPAPRMLRQFAVLWLLFVGGLAAWQGWVLGREALGAALAVVAIAVAAVGCWRPAAIRPVFVGAMILAFPIGWTVSRILLAGIYFGLFTPLALIFRVLGRDALRLKRSSEATSYWQSKPRAEDPRRYFRQY